LGKKIWSPELWARMDGGEFVGDRKNEIKDQVAALARRIPAMPERWCSVCYIT
jgi:hypothetical protein